MKFLVLAALLTLSCASTLYRGKNISVNDDGTILITGENGKRVIITRPNGLNGQKNIEISVNGPNMPTKHIQINDQQAGEDVNLFQDSNVGQYPYGENIDEEMRWKRGSTKKSSQGDILAQILKDYQGVVDEASYQKLLQRIDKAVKKGEISSTIYGLLEELEQNQITVDDAFVLGKQIDSQNVPIQQVQGGLYQGQSGLAALLGRQGIYSGIRQPQYGINYGVGTGYGVGSSYPGVLSSQYGVNPGYGVNTGYGVGINKIGTGYQTGLPWYLQRQVTYGGVQSGLNGLQGQNLWNTNQIPSLAVQNSLVRGIGSNLYGLGAQQPQQYLGTSQYINPLLPVQQSTYLGNIYGQQPIVDVTRQLPQVLEGELNNQIVYGNVPLTTSSRGILSGQQPLLKEYLLARNQVPVVQGQGLVQEQGLVGNELNNILYGKSLPVQSLYGLKEGYGINQQQPIVLQNERLYLQPVGIPQIVY